MTTYAELPPNAIFSPASYTRADVYRKLDPANYEMFWAKTPGGPCDDCGASCRSANFFGAVTVKDSGNLQVHICQQTQVITP